MKFNSEFPKREEAEKILAGAESCNPGPWVNHSRVTAGCAEKIALVCGDMNVDKAYVLGLLHDIGRKFGVKHMGHIYDGYTYMQNLGYGAVARICLTHSFSIQDIHTYVGNRDITKQQQEELKEALSTLEYDDYDRLIQLCDSLAGPDGVMNIEARMLDVKRRYGDYPQEKWDMNLKLKKIFEQKAGENIYDIVR